MAIVRFPDPRTQASPEGILAIGGDLEVESLCLAYRNGIFPWPLDEKTPLLWFCPPQRAILEFKNLHVSRSLLQAQKKMQYEFTLNKVFERVIDACSSIPRPDQPGTWITSELKRAYVRLHHQGYAHSVEVWHKSQLVGGLYGVGVDGTFAGESMFHTASNASKLAILYLIEALQLYHLKWMDIQTLTPHMEAMGAREIPRDTFLDLLKRSQIKGKKIFEPLKP